MPFKIRNVQFVFARHGQADPAKVGQRDRDRPLNETGRRQATMVRRALTGTFFDLALISPTKRNRQTAEIALEDMQPRMVKLGALLNHPDRKVNADIKAMYKVLGHTTLRAYLRHPKAEALRRFAEHAASEIDDVVALHAAETVTFSVFVCGNGVLMNAIISEMFPDCADNVLDFVFTECGAVEIPVDHHGNATFNVVD